MSHAAVETTPSEPLALLVVADDRLARSFERRLRARGYRVAGSVSSVAEAVPRVAERRPDLALIVLDGNADATLTAGLEMAERFGIGALFITHTGEIAEQAARYGVRCLTLPVRVRELDLAILAVATQAALVRQTADLYGLASLGAVAGGVAHEFNNILTSIAGNAELALFDLAQESDARQSVLQIQASVRRAALFARQILMLAGRVRVNTLLFDLNAMLRELMPLLTLIVGKRAEFQTRLNPEQVMVAGDASRVRQMIVGLVVDAAAIVDEGVVLLSTRREAVGLSCLEVRCTPRAGEEIHESLVALLTPYTAVQGLGLAAAQRIAHSLGGEVEASQDDGGAMVVRVVLPSGR